jgi:hypothetical protein
MAVLAPTIILAFVMLQAVPLEATLHPTAQPQQAGDAREMKLALPHALRKGETVWLLVEVGAIGHNQIQLMTENGRPLGTISPYGVRSGQAAGIYTVPIPAEAVVSGQLVLQLSVLQSGRAQRAPTTEEIKSVRIVVR